MRKLFLLLLLSLAAAAGAQDLLEPEKAFRFSARALDASSIEVRYQIAPGYYMYREKFRFDARPVSVRLAAAQLPPGKIKEDQFFGKVQTYRDDVRIVLPLERQDQALGTVTVKVTYQGCADVGVCYIPQEDTASLMLAVADGAGASALAPPRALSSSAQPPGAAIAGSAGPGELLHPDKAFTVSVELIDAENITVRLAPASGHYLYRDKTTFLVGRAPGLSIAAAELPAGERRDDPNFGSTEVFHQAYQAQLKLRRESGSGESAALAVNYQGCSDQGICYPPMTRVFNLRLDKPGKASGGELANVVPGGNPFTASATPAGTDESVAVRLLTSGGFWLILATFFGYGLALAFTPCVFPMVPILSGIIVGQGTHVTRLGALALSVAYVLGMAVTYAAAGVAAGLSGAMLSAALQNPWVLGGFAVVMVLLALSMFGFYELQLPTALQSWVFGATQRMTGGHIVSVFAMGGLSAVIVGPCVAAPLAGALLYISQTRDAALGGAALFSMALGMGVPLVAFAVSARSLLPKTGPWMESVKRLFGVLLLGVALWMVSPVMPALAQMLGWAALLIVSAMYLHALDPLPAGASGFVRLWKGVGVVALLVGSAILIGALAGGRDPLQPLSGLRLAGASTQTPHGVGFERIRDTGELDQRIRGAAGRPVMLDFYADWCVSCKEMERFTFADPTVQVRLKKVLLLQADVTANSAADRALLARFNLFGPPGIVFFDQSGNELKNVRVIGFQNAERFGTLLDAVLRGSSPTDLKLTSVISP